MNKLFIIPILATAVLASQYNGSTTGVVTVVGSYIKAHDAPINQKYKRKDCPVCKGTGKYLSGDGIKMVDCGYCEPEKPQQFSSESISYNTDNVDRVDDHRKQLLTDTIALYVVVPTDDTKLYINGNRTSIKGKERVFICEGLEKGHEYDFSMRIFYDKNNQQLQQVKVFRLISGEKRHINFNE